MKPLVKKISIDNENLLYYSETKNKKLSTEDINAETQKLKSQESL